MDYCSFRDEIMEGLHLLEMVVHAKSPGIVDMEGVSSETAIEKLNSENIEKNQRWDTSIILSQVAGLEVN